MTGRRPVGRPLVRPGLPLLVLLLAVLAHAGFAATPICTPPEHGTSVANLEAVAAVTPLTASEPCVGCDDAGDVGSQRAHHVCTAERPCHDAPQNEHGPTESAVRAADTGQPGGMVVLPVRTVPRVPDRPVAVSAAPIVVAAAAREPVAVLCVNRN